MSLEVAVKAAFKGFTLDVDFRTDGEMLGILGASGCGKSMTLKCVAGIQTPDQGRVVRGGTVLYDSAKRVNVRPQGRRVGYLFQSYALFPHMQVEENIGCGLMGVDKAEKGRRVARQIRRFRLEGLEHRYPGQLSGGQQQRVALARILASEPEVLLLDEPFSALDSHLKEQLQLELMDCLQDYEGDVLMVTHSRDEAYRLCKRLLVMDEGRCVASGDTKELFRGPDLLTVARLTGCKNISRARQSGPDTVYAQDWGLSLRVNGPIPEGLDHVGIRAHHFFPGDGPNSFPVTVHRELESPFEWNLLVTAPGTREGASIWWKVPKEAYAGPPAALWVDPKDILLLRSS